MDEDVPALPQFLVNPTNSSLKMRLQVRRGAVHDIKTIALEVDALFCVGVDGGEPGSVEHLDEGGDVGLGEEDRVEDGGEGPEVECACLLAGRGGGAGRDDLVHGGAHGLHDFGGESVEANHRGL